MLPYPKIIASICLVGTLLALSGCGAVTSSSVSESLSKRNWTVNSDSPPERAYCSNSKSLNGHPFHVTGKAVFKYRTVGTDLGEEGLREVAADPKPIRHAQFEVVNAAGEILQCGETDAGGNFDLWVPNNYKALTLNVYARSNNSFNKASVFIAPETNELHKIQYFFTANNDKTDVVITAEAVDDLAGGAFNILDQIHNTFDTLKTLVTPSQGVQPENIPKVDIYWEKGFNPGVYVGVTDSGLSFFSKPKLKLFILGGRNGDVDFEDTDHFDNSIIVHEYFHFLENTISQSHSPGGPHNGNQIVDPRLAWSEGAAQFFQAVVSGLPTVLDTRGNVDGDTGFYLKFSVEEEGVNDTPVEEGEGEFREFAVARLLWDLYDTEDGEVAPEEFDSVVNEFSKFWKAFANTSHFGLNSANAYFASAGLLLDTINANNTVQSNTAWENLLAHSKFVSDSGKGYRSNYAQPLDTCAGSATSSFTDFSYSEVSKFENNHPVVNINFYTVVVPTGSTRTIRFSSTTTNGSGGAVSMYAFPYNYVNFSESIAGPVSANTNLILSDPGVYLIGMLLSSLPTSVGSGTSLNYTFSNYCKGGF